MIVMRMNAVQGEQMDCRSARAGAWRFSSDECSVYDGTLPHDGLAFLDDVRRRVMDLIFVEEGVGRGYRTHRLLPRCDMYTTSSLSATRRAPPYKICPKTPRRTSGINQTGLIRRRHFHAMCA